MVLECCIVAFSKLPSEPPRLSTEQPPFCLCFENKESQDGKTERKNTKMLNKAECLKLNLVAWKICDFLWCCLFLLRCEGFGHTRCLEAVGAEGGRGKWAPLSILMACRDYLWPVAWCHLESGQLAARAACYAAKWHINVQTVRTSQWSRNHYKLTAQMHPLWYIHPWECCPAARFAWDTCRKT